MRTAIIFFAFIFFSSCTISSKIRRGNNCSFKEVSLSYEERTDSTAVLKLQKLGTNYLNFVINSCAPNNKNTVRLKGYVYNFDVSAKDGMLKLQGAKIIEAINNANEELVYKSVLGITNHNGEFDIEVSLENPKMYILVNKEKYRPCSVQLLK
jgi:hypothetical protein